MSLRLRVSTIRRKGKVYRYHQLTRAVRKNGKPTHEVVAHLGRLEEDEATAIRDALKKVAARRKGADGGEHTTCRLDKLEPVAALRYLDVAVVHRLWQQLGLGEFFEREIPRGRALMSPAHVVEVLVANRCLAPCSKLRVTEWAPRTALPELLGFRADRLRNTRVHRVLDALESIEPALTRFLVTHPIRGKVDSVIYLDFTDTWFVGCGGDLGAAGRGKDGAKHDRLIQIALAVDSRGLPLRWEVLPGGASESKMLPSWITAVEQHPEFADVPLVFDRGFSVEGNLAELVARQRRFVTCARAPVLESWSDTVDFAAIAVTPANTSPDPEVLLSAGLTPSPDDDDVFYVDQGVRRPCTKRKDMPPMRVVLYFRPSQYKFDTYRSDRQRKKILAKVEDWNTELLAAKLTRKESTTRRKVERLLEKHHFEIDYSIRLEPITVIRGSKPLGSFRIHLDPRREGPARRDRNAGWRVLLASPEDDRPARDLIRLYDGKHAVEYAFRTIKSFVGLRPVRHQRTPKIKAHVTLCVLGMLLDRWMELQLRDAGIHDAVDRVYEALEPCRLHVLDVDTGAQRLTHRTLTKINAHQHDLLSALNMNDVASQSAVQALTPPA